MGKGVQSTEETGDTSDKCSLIEMVNVLTMEMNCGLISLKCETIYEIHSTIMYQCFEGQFCKSRDFLHWVSLPSPTNSFICSFSQCGKLDWAKCYVMILSGLSIF